MDQDNRYLKHWVLSFPQYQSGENHDEQDEFLEELQDLLRKRATQRTTIFLLPHQNHAVPRDLDDQTKVFVYYSHNGTSTGVKRSRLETILDGLQAQIFNPDLFYISSHSHRSQKNEVQEAMEVEYIAQNTEVIENKSNLYSTLTKTHSDISPIDISEKLEKKFQAEYDNKINELVQRNKYLEKKNFDLENKFKKLRTRFFQLKAKTKNHQFVEKMEEEGVEDKSNGSGESEKSKENEGKINNAGIQNRSVNDQQNNKCKTSKKSDLFELGVLTGQSSLDLANTAGMKQVCRTLRNHEDVIKVWNKPLSQEGVSNFWKYINDVDPPGLAEICFRYEVEIQDLCKLLCFLLIECGNDFALKTYKTVMKGLEKPEVRKQVCQYLEEYKEKGIPYR